MTSIPTGKFTVRFDDGTEAETKIRPKALVEAERRWPDRSPDHSDAYPMFEGMHFVVWASLGKPGGDFDAWLDTVEDVTSVSDDTADPSPPTVGDD